MPKDRLETLTVMGPRANPESNGSTHTDPPAISTGTMASRQPPARRVERMTSPRMISPDGEPMQAQPDQPSTSTAPLRVMMLYDMDACHGPTGVTRHALAQLERLARRTDVALRLISGRMTHPDGLAYWASLEELPRSELPIRTRDLLRWWRIKPWPTIDWLAGPADWVYCPAEFAVPTRAGKTGRDQPRRIAAPAVPTPQESRTAVDCLWQSGADPFGLGVQHPSTDRSVPRVCGSSSLRAQRGRGPVLRAGQCARSVRR